MNKSFIKVWAGAVLAVGAMLPLSASALNAGPFENLAEFQQEEICGNYRAQSKRTTTSHIGWPHTTYKEQVRLESRFFTWYVDGGQLKPNGVACSGPGGANAVNMDQVKYDVSYKRPGGAWVYSGDLTYNTRTGYTWKTKSGVSHAYLNKHAYITLYDGNMSFHKDTEIKVTVSIRKKCLGCSTPTWWNNEYPRTYLWGTVHL